MLHIAGRSRGEELPASTRVGEEPLKNNYGHAEMKTLLLRTSFLKDEKGEGVHSGAFKAILNSINTSNKTNVLNWLYYGQFGERRREKAGSSISCDWKLAGPTLLFLTPCRQPTPPQPPAGQLAMFPRSSRCLGLWTHSRH